MRAKDRDQQLVTWHRVKDWAGLPVTKLCPPISERRKDDHEITRERNHETEIANQSSSISCFRTFVFS